MNTRSQSKALLKVNPLKVNPLKVTPIEVKPIKERIENTKEEKGIYAVDIDFDEASTAWRSNKKHLGNGYFRYIPFRNASASAKKVSPITEGRVLRSSTRK